ncbi:MAG TPA: bifunctional metallophosphatase/5'-nucleotidase [Thioalkalivibrio sp.]|nr:bifunctional metallophosphatase/5'-nucleotidase [Thioalkalivibrio sp.]
MSTRRFTILHSNDLHGDFVAESEGPSGHLIGGLSLLLGYLNKVRREEDNVIYVIAGDMMQGSLIDSEFRGISTVELMNYVAPDVVTLGNHEFDYGLPHLLFLERVANFPIVNANLYIRNYNRRLMRPYHVMHVAGYDILFIGVITEKVMSSIVPDEQIGSFISLEEACAEVGHITNAYKNDDIDLTVLLTHIGYESDLELASMLDPEWGVDMIIGGHSHTVLEQPAVVNGIQIAHAGVGTDQIGRFDIVVDGETNSIIESSWKLVPIDTRTIEPDPKLREYIASFRDTIDRKYNTLIVHLGVEATHPCREVETSLGNLTADALVAATDADVMMVGSGSIRAQALGPAVTLQDLLACYPYDDALTRHTVTGADLKRIFAHIMRPENRTGEGECFQVNHGVVAEYDEANRRLISLRVGGRPVADERTYRLVLQDYHVRNAEANLGITTAEMSRLARPRVVSTSLRDVLQEYLRDHQNRVARVEGRLVYR